MAFLNGGFIVLTILSVVVAVAFACSGSVEDSTSEEDYTSEEESVNGTAAS